MRGAAVGFYKAAKITARASLPSRSWCENSGSGPNGITPNLLVSVLDQTNCAQSDAPEGQPVFWPGGGVQASPDEDYAQADAPDAPPVCAEA